jgi:hypothetical protein
VSASSARERDALALAAREVDSPLADQRLQPVGQRLDEARQA